MLKKGRSANPGATAKRRVVSGSATLLPAQQGEVLELDEMWSFVDVVIRWLEEEPRVDSATPTSTLPTRATCPKSTINPALRHKTRPTTSNASFHRAPERGALGQEDTLLLQETVASHPTPALLRRYLQLPRRQQTLEHHHLNLHHYLKLSPLPQRLRADAHIHPCIIKGRRPDRQFQDFGYSDTTVTRIKF